jgi:hypothetical protein
MVENHGACRDFSALFFIVAKCCFDRMFLFFMYYFFSPKRTPAWLTKKTQRLQTLSRCQGI